MTKRRRILYADKIIQNVIQIFCLLMFLQLKDNYTVASNPFLLYSTESDIRLVDVTKPSKAKVIVSGLAQGSAVDFLYQKDLICWCDQSAESIQCMMDFKNGKSGEQSKIVSEGLITPTGIAIDWYTNKIYWTDGDTNRIEVISIENKNRKVLFWSEVDLARAIAVVPKEGLIFWTDWGEVPKIERAGMDGDALTRRVIVKEDIFWPNGITIDYDNNLVYWVDAKLQFVDVIDFEGQNRRRVVKGGLEYPYALTYFDSKLYWTDWKNWTIYTWDINTNGPIEKLIKSDPVPVDIKVYDTSRQMMPTEDYPCKVKNGGCSHLCLLSPTSPGYICACPTGVKLREDSNTTCYNGPQSLLLVAQRTVISKISLDSPDFTPNTLPLKDLRRALSVDFDPKSEFIYWSDTLAKTISRARLDGSEQSVIIHSSGGPDSIAIDALARNIYWSDPVTDTISVAKLDGSSTKVIIHEELYEPRAIALHQTAGIMFWSDWNDKKPKIERANLDGSDRVLLVSEKITWPNGLAIDVVNNKLYWGDARTHKIEVCNMDGSGRTELHNKDITHIFGLTILGEHLYWTDMQKRTLDRINKNTGLDREPIVEQMANMLGVKAFKIGERRGWNHCADNNGGCSHLCFNRPQDYVCSCPIALELSSDRKTCIEPEAFLVYSRKNIIGRISVENENNDAVLPIKELKEVSALATHVSGGKIYWSDSKTKTISRCSINGSSVEKILDWSGLVEGLAIDWSGQNIYWTDTVLQRIEVARLDGSSRRTIIWQGLKRPKSIVLDPKKGQMYWSELGSKSIKRASMDGSSPTVFMEQVGRVHSLAIDYEKRAIYWASLDPPTIEYAYLNGTGRKVLADNTPMPYAVALYNEKVFWGDWNTGLIEVAKKTDGTNRKTIYKKLDYLSDMKVFHRSRSAGGNQCEVDNGGCVNLCLAVPADTRTDYKCACPTHYKLDSDNITCSEPEEFLLYAQKNSIGRIMITNGECNDAPIPVTGLKNVKAIDYDPVNNHLYWMDDDSHSIRRVPISYVATSAITESSVVVTGLSRPFHMVLDVIGRTLYWTCADTDSINATTVDGNSSSGVIMKEENMMPRHLAFHQTKRYLIWNDVGIGAIMRSNVDGTDRIELARASNATALAIDQTTASVYWAVNRQLHAVDIDGRNKRVVWQGGWVGAVSIYSGSAYLCGGERPPFRLPLHRRDAPAQPLPHLPRIRATRTVHPVSRSHPCFGGLRCGGGAAACGAGGACGCGVRCAPRARPAPRAPPACPPRHYLCHHRTPTSPPHCIPHEWRCDGQVDCADGSDEGGSCGSCVGGVRCADGACAHALSACPTGAFCPQGPLPDAFRCDDRLCLSPALLCDGRQHCEDGSDEAPTACGYITKDQSISASTPRGRGWGVAGVCGAVILLCAVIAGLGLAAARCRHQPPPAPAHLPLCVHPTVKLAPHQDRTDSSNSGTLATDSLCSRWPQPTANPPPSPASASVCSAGGGGAGAGRRRAYRHYRAINRPPPPTPASTDAGESEHEPGAPPPSPCLTLSY